MKEKEQPNRAAEPENGGNAQAMDDRFNPQSAEMRKLHLLRHMAHRWQSSCPSGEARKVNLVNSSRDKKFQSRIGLIVVCEKFQDKRIFCYMIHPTHVYVAIDFKPSDDEPTDVLIRFFEMCKSMPKKWGSQAR